MAQSDTQTLIMGVVVLAVVLALVYLVDPTFFGLVPLKQGFQSSNGEVVDPGMFANDGETDVAMTESNPNAEKEKKNMEGAAAEAFGDMADYGEASQEAQQPAGCYPRDQLNPSELLPVDQNSTWAQQNPMGPGSLKGKNFLSAGALLGVNTVGQSLRNANWQLRSEPPNPQIPVSIFNQSTIQPDVNRRPLEIN